MDTHDTEAKTRANLAYLWTIISGLMLGYTLYKWGGEKEILTLIIGLIGGTITGGIFGFYFGGTVQKKQGTDVNVTGDSPVVPVNQVKE